MKLNKKTIIEVATLLIFTGVTFFYFLSKPNESPVQNLTQYTNNNLGITIEHTPPLKTYSPKSISFAECEDCPWMISVTAQKIYDETLDEAYSPYKDRGKMIEKISIAGEPAIETIPYSEYTILSNERQYFVIHEGYLYRISDRFNQTDEDRKRFIDGINFTN
jgi:hypothetical protein